MTDGLLLLHAFPLDARMWARQADVLSGEAPVVAPHLPGFGGTPGAGDVMTMDAAATRVLERLDASSIDRAVVCGLSMGGYVAFELWRRAPERIAGLVLANTRAGADDESAAQKRQALAKRLLTEGNAFLVEHPPPLLSESAPDEVRAFVRGTIADQPAEAIAAASLGMAERPDSTADLGTIDVPTLVITSDADALIPAELTAPMASQIADARLATIARAGHLSNLEAPAEFGRLLGDHARRCGLSVPESLD